MERQRFICKTAAGARPRIHKYSNISLGFGRDLGPEAKNLGARGATEITHGSYSMQYSHSIGRRDTWYYSLSSTST